MSDFNDQLRRYIDGLGEPVTTNETMSHGSPRRFRVPAAILAGAAIVLVPAIVLFGLRFLPVSNDEVAQTTSVIPETTTAPTTTSAPKTTTSMTKSSTAEMPDLTGLTVEQANDQLSSIGLSVEVTEEHPSRTDFGLITAQDPVPGGPVEAGSSVMVGVRIEAGCLGYEPPADTGTDSITLLFECANDGFHPGEWAVVTRSIDAGRPPIPAMLEALLSGPTPLERAEGLQSFFSEESANALDAVSLGPNGHLVVDFNQDIIINNASTSTGGMFFTAELQANLFQLREVNEIEFQIDGSCLAFGNWLQIGECPIWTRAAWEQAVAAWDAERSQS
jgi:hypothetical protein